MRHIGIAVILKICFANSLFGQVADLVESAAIHPGIHENNIGRIFFTNQQIPGSRLTEKDFLSTFTLTNKSNLFFIAFLENSLTNFAHRLSPGISADSLVKVGNFQFALFIDKKLIYRSNLNPGAPYPKILDTATILNRPLVDNIHGSGSWSESFWNRFLHYGGDSALTDGPHLLTMEIRPYVKSDTLLVGDIMAAGELSMLVQRNPPINISTIRLAKPKPYDGFAVSGESFDQDKIKNLKGKIDIGAFKKISSVIVIKQGKILIEEYFNGATRSTLHDTRSVGKSFTSTLMGMAIKDGYIKSTSQPLQDFYPLKTYANYSAAKEQVRISELLTMSSVFDGNDEDDSSPGNEENMYPTADWVKFALDLPVVHNKPPGEWHYFTAGVVLLGDILNKQVKGGLESYAAEKLFKPLHISSYKWQYTPQQVPNTAGGIQMNALDFAKYGQLYKNDGVWNHQQIIPRDWVKATFTKQLPITGRQHEYYGYLFWNRSFLVQDKWYEANYCAGNGGNYILVFKDLPLVVVVTATAYGMPYAHPQVAKMLTEYILPAVINK